MKLRKKIIAKKFLLKDSFYPVQSSIMSSRSDIISSLRKKARKSDKKEQLETQNALMKLANERAEECNTMLKDKLGTLLAKYKD